MSDLGAPIFVDSIQDLLKAIPSSSKRVFLCDSHTKEACFDRLQIKEDVIVIQAGEENKNMATVEHVIQELLNLGLGRKDYLICLGGGVVTDLGGFTGNIYKRGVQILNIPTSLLGMVDAAIGGKNGIDFRSIKNLLGTFNWVDSIIFPGFLETLSWSEIQNGYMEMIKHGLIASEKHYHKTVALWKAKELPTIETVRESIHIKTMHCMEDFKDLGMRNRLNFGHTVGHAIEGVALEKGQFISHGLAVGLGMMVESQLSLIKTNLSSEENRNIHSVLEPLKDEVDLTSISCSDILRFAQKDKKNSSESASINFVGLTRIGEARQNQWCTSKELKEALKIIDLHD